MSLPAAPAVDDLRKACFDSALFAAEPTTARKQCVVGFFLQTVYS